MFKIKHWVWKCYAYFCGCLCSHCWVGQADFSGWVGEGCCQLQQFLFRFKGNFNCMKTPNWTGSTRSLTQHPKVPSQNWYLLTISVTHRDISIQVRGNHLDPPQGEPAASGQAGSALFFKHHINLVKNVSISPVDFSGHTIVSCVFLYI